MEWRTFVQRMILLAALSGLVIGLIAGGLDPTVALMVAGGILLLLKDAWLPNSDKIDTAAEKVNSSAKKPAESQSLTQEGDANSEASPDTPQLAEADEASSEETAR